MMKALTRSLVALSMPLVLASCAGLGFLAPGTGDPAKQTQSNPSLISNNAGGFAGHVAVPAQLISNNAGGLVSNNAGGLVSNNAGGYRIAALSEVPLANSLVYFLQPSEEFYIDDQGRRLLTTTDASGSYALTVALAEGKPVIVSAMLSGNRRMVGYTVTKAGVNTVDVSLASTYVTEFLRAEAARNQKTMADYPQALSKLPDLVAETQHLLDTDRLPVPDLTIGAAAAMNKVYFATFASSDATLANLWHTVLGGDRLIPVTTVLGDYTLGSMESTESAAVRTAISRPTGVAVDPSGNVYVATTGNHVLRKIKPDGTTEVLGAFRGDGSVTTPAFNVPTFNETSAGGPDGIAFAEMQLPKPLDVACDADGNVAMTCDGIHAIVILCMKDNSHLYGHAMQKGKAYSLGDTSGSDDPTERFADGAAKDARFRTPHGLCFDDQGNLFVADRRNNLVRRIDRATGTVMTVAGHLVPNGEAAMGDQLEDLTDSTDLNELDAAQHLLGRLNRPFQVAWRRIAGGKEELYIWEGANPISDSELLRSTGNAIRRVTMGANAASFEAVETLAGGRDLHGFSGDGGPAAEAKLGFVDANVSRDVPNGGLALDPTAGLLYLSDTLNQRIRVIRLDVASHPIVTAAGGGSEEGDAEAHRARFADVSGLAVDAHGNVYVCDMTNNVVRRITYEYGR